ncbi:MAG: hypothetical protein BGP01_00360 [Paludibacter sp. 47-17]|nr:MAG: hypothetical protein BGP01_00360 [Paludibacter sp. 47-17]
MESHKVKMFLLSDALIGASEGYGAIIDKDSVFDEVGLPIIPGKRIKGILRSEAKLLNTYKPIKLSNNNTTDDPVELLFGKPGNTNIKNESVYVSNFCVDEYDANKVFLRKEIKQGRISRSEVISYFTALRTTTRINEDGIAAETSLRTIRVLKRGFHFVGELAFDNQYVSVFKDILSLTRRIGSMRNRGLGQISCSLIDSNKHDLESLNGNEK